MVILSTLQSPREEALQSAGQKIPCLLSNTKVHYHSLPTQPILSPTTPIYTTKPTVLDSFYIHVSKVPHKLACYQTWASEGDQPPQL